MRLFVAIFPPVEIREALREAASVLQVRGKVRWIPASNIHLTLKFLGEAGEEKLREIRSVLEEVAQRHGSFEIELSGFGAFPSGRKARVLWSGVSEGADQLRDIAGDLESAFEAIGFEGERRTYSPHMTLGRARGRPATLDSGQNGELLLTFSARRLELVRSVLDREGARYSTIAEYPLTGRPRTEVRSP